MKIVGCDLHARQQTIAMVDTETGEFVERTLSHEGNAHSKQARLLVLRPLKARSVAHKTPNGILRLRMIEATKPMRHGDCEQYQASGLNGPR